MKRTKATLEMINCHHETYGGHMSDIPLPIIRMSDVGIKRTVDIRITTYRGYCLDAVHYYVGTTVSNNMIWNSDKKGWVSPWDDKQETYNYDKSFKSITSARRYAKEISNNFPSDFFNVTIHDCEKTDEGLGEGD